MIVSPLLLAELERVLSRPKFAVSIDRAQVDGLVTGLMEDGLLVEDPPADPGLTPDPGDDYLVALARVAGAQCIVSETPTCPACGCRAAGPLAGRVHRAREVGLVWDGFAVVLPVEHDVAKGAVLHMNIASLLFDACSRSVKATVYYTRSIDDNVAPTALGKVTVHIPHGDHAHRPRAKRGHNYTNGSGASRRSSPGSS